jgi:hypothetical protein
MKVWKKLIIFLGDLFIHSFIVLIALSVVFAVITLCEINSTGNPQFGNYIFEKLKTIGTGGTK